MVKLVRFRHGEAVRYGILEGDTIYALDGDPLGSFTKGKPRAALKDVVLLPPCEPTKIVGVGLNYRDHAQSVGAPFPEEPLLFLKAPTTVIGDGAEIVWPIQSERIDFEAELAIVVGKPTRDVALDEARSRVLGYTCANDITARDLQRRDGQWSRAKSFDTFCPLGPFIALGIDPGDLSITSRVNGEVRQSSTTANLIFGIPYLISFISRVMTLLPGDVILTGTPAGTGPLRVGDEVEIEIGPIGPLRNRLVRRA